MTFAAPELKRGQIWMVEFGTPIGSELGAEHPAVIVSADKLNASIMRTRSIIVPGTSTRFENPRTKEVIVLHQEVPSSASNGLHHTTYFMAEQIRAASCMRFRRLVGSLESRFLKSIEDRLCLVLNLFEQ